MAKGLVLDRVSNDAGKIVYTALKQREHSGALDVAKSKDIFINRRRGLICQRRKLTPQQEQGVRSRLKMIWENSRRMFLQQRESNLTQNSLHKISFAEKLHSHSRGEIANQLQRYEMQDPRKLSQNLR